MLTRILAALALTVALAVPAHADATSDANKRVVMDMIQMLFVDHKVDEAIDKYFAPDYIQHNPMVATGREPVRGFFKQFYAQTPQAHVNIKRVVAEGDLVVVHYNGVFTADPNDRGFAVVDIFRVKDGKIVEHWDVMMPVPEKANNENGMF